MKLSSVLFLLFSLSLETHAEIKVGSKKFTESVILAEVLTLSLSQKKIATKHIAEFGGTRILWNALIAGNIDVYPEYTSTIEAEILQAKFRNPAELRAALAKYGLGLGPPLGFQNTYALGMKKAKAKSLGILKISDLRRHPDLKIGWSEEFLRRADGWPGLREKYQLPQQDLRALDHDVAYRALESGDIDLIDLYSTDAEIQYYDLLILEDDGAYFPPYEAIFLYRLPLAATLDKSLKDLSHQISATKMIEMNRRAKIDKVPADKIAADFLNQNLAADAHPLVESRAQRIWACTQEHLYLVFVSLLVAIVVGIPLGLIAYKNELGGRFILWIVGGIQTIPSLALLVILIKPLNWIGLTGIGNTPALIALFLYSLLPIVRGAHAGLMQIPRSLRETSAVLNLSSRTRILRIELPLALPTILSGIKTAAVMNVGFATLGALVGAGGYGQPILTGIRLDDYNLILEGALPSALLALIVQQGFDWAERILVSPGLRR